MSCSKDIITATGQVKSSTIETKQLERGTIYWSTSLQPDQGEHLVKSPVCITHSGTPYEAKWQLVLDPNFKSPDGTRYLSVWVQMLELHPDQSKLPCMVTINLVPEGSAGGFQYSKTTGIDVFTRDSSCYGFKQFIPYYNVSTTSQQNKLMFFVTLFIFTDVKGAIMHQQIQNAKTSGGELEIIKMDEDESNLHLDATILIGKKNCPVEVDSTKLSLHSGVFRNFFAGSGPRELYDASMEIPSESIGRFVIDYCHAGRLTRPLPKKVEHVALIMETCALFEIESLRKLCQTQLLDNLSAENFVFLANLCLSGLMDYISRPRLSDYLKSNLYALNKNEEFVTASSCKRFKRFCEDLVFDDDENSESC